MVSDLNVVILTGRLTRDPDLRESAKALPICTFAVALNRYRKNESGDGYATETSFVDVTAFGVLAKQCGEGLAKGRVARVMGRLKQERWQDGHGTNKTKTVVIADRVEWLSPKRDEDAEDAEPAPHELTPEMGD